MLMQEMWLAGTEWNDLLLDEIVKMKIWFRELDELQEIKIPRGLQQRGVGRSVSLHTFVDASQSAYIWRSCVCQD